MSIMLELGMEGFRCAGGVQLLDGPIGVVHRLRRGLDQRPVSLQECANGLFDWGKGKLEGVESGPEGDYVYLRQWFWG